MAGCCSFCGVGCIHGAGVDGVAMALVGIATDGEDGTGDAARFPLPSSRLIQPIILYPPISPVYRLMMSLNRYTRRMQRLFVARNLYHLCLLLMILNIFRDLRELLAYEQPLPWTQPFRAPAAFSSYRSIPVSFLSGRGRRRTGGGAESKFTASPFHLQK